MTGGDELGAASDKARRARLIVGAAQFALNLAAGYLNRALDEYRDKLAEAAAPAPPDPDDADVIDIVAAGERYARDADARARASGAG